MFVQADRTLDRSQGGLGIGLTFVQRIVQMHGGSVEAKSAGAGQGSEFSIRLPVVADVDATISSPSSVEAHPARMLKILVAEDNRDSATTMAILLKDLGHEIEVAHDGSEVLKLASIFQPDVFLIDLGLPVLNGFDVAKRLRQQTQFRDNCLIAVTGYGSPQDQDRSEKAGFNFHLVKPVNFEELRKLLATLG
jgi:CheY-like chemotaxis protein